MGNLGYVVKRLRTMDYSAMGEKIDLVKKKTGKSKLSIFLDMQDCARKHGAGYVDYDLFALYDVPKSQRNTYLTRGRNNALVIKYCDKSFLPDFVNKDKFNEKFGEFLGRDWVKVQGTPKEKVIAFLEKHETFMVKEIVGSCGKGVDRWHTRDFPSLDAIYEQFGTRNIILEELIVQHDDVNKMYPDCINTVRVVTIVTTKDNKSLLTIPAEQRQGVELVSHVICTYFRIGNGGCVDNFNSGGIVTPIDEKTGIVREVGYDKKENVYDNHPVTGTPFKGFQLPCWNEVLDLCKRASLVVPEMGYAGWDVAVTPTGAVFVEGNDFPGHNLYQLPPHTGDKIGMMPKFQGF